MSRALEETPALSPAQGQDQSLQAWRESAQAVSWAWNGWLAAGGDQRTRQYHAYVAALEEEERTAAQLARALPRAG